MDATGFDGLSAAFFTIDQDDGEFDVTTFAFDSVDGFQSRSSGSDDIIDDDHILAGGEIAFDLFSGAVTFGFFANRENLECFIGMLAGGGHADGKGNRIGSKGHAADGLDGEFFRMDFGADCVPAEVADHGCAERIEGCDAAIDVEIRLFS